jgi:hypothetical protein
MIPRFDEAPAPAPAATTDEDDDDDLQPPPERRQELDLSVDPSLLSLDAVLSQQQQPEVRVRTPLEARLQQQAAEETALLKTTREKEKWTGSHEGQRIPLFTAAQLDNLNGVQLKNLCDRWGLRSGNRKVAELRARILEEVKLQHKHSVVVNEISDILRRPFRGQAKPNALYKDWFNLVDINNRLYQSVSEHHRWHNWCGKMLSMLLRVAIIDAWIFSVQIKGIPWMDWREQLAMELIGDTTIETSTHPHQ